MAERVIRFLTEDGREFRSEEEAEFWEQRCKLVQDMCDTSCLTLNDCECAVDWLMARYDVEPKKPAGPVCTVDIKPARKVTRATHGG